LAERLRAQGLQVLLTREPGGTALAERIRALVREIGEDPPNARAETLLFLASRAQLVENVVRPALAAGTWVLCDRFADSTFAYQGYGRGLNLTELKALNAFATGGLVPDRTILLDVPPETAAARLRAREQTTQTAADRMERAGDDFHARLKAGFLELAAAEPERFAVVAADGGVDEVAETVWNLIQPML
jgi:dTMP kinase